MEKSGRISLEVISRTRGLREFGIVYEQEISRYLERNGFHLVSDAAEWHVDPFPHSPALLKPGKKHLYFITCTMKVVKLEKSLAEKYLVLGLP